MAFKRARNPTLPRVPIRRDRPRADDNPSAETTLLVVRRASRNGVVCCELCGGDVKAWRGLNWALHHRRYRDGRPDSHQPQNLILVHGASNVDECHGRIHADKGEAMANGWSITRHGCTDPLTVPVLIDHESRWAYLTVDGGYAEDPPDDLMCGYLDDDGTLVVEAGRHNSPVPLIIPVEVEVWSHRYSSPGTGLEWDGGVELHPRGPARVVPDEAVNG